MYTRWEPLITPRDFARLAGVRPRLVLDLLEKDLIIGAKEVSHRHWAIPLSSLDRYLAGERPDPALRLERQLGIRQALGIAVEETYVAARGSQRQFETGPVGHLSPREFARRVDLTPRTVVNLIHEGLIEKARKTTTGRWRIAESEVNRYLGSPPASSPSIGGSELKKVVGNSPASSPSVRGAARLAFAYDDYPKTQYGFARLAGRLPRDILMLMRQGLFHGAFQEKHRCWRIPHCPVNLYIAGVLSEMPTGLTRAERRDIEWARNEAKRLLSEGKHTARRGAPRLLNPNESGA